MNICYKLVNQIALNLLKDFGLFYSCICSIYVRGVVHFDNKLSGLLGAAVRAQMSFLYSHKLDVIGHWGAHIDISRASLIKT